MVQVAQVEQPEQKYVTDGNHVYPFNEYLQELVDIGAVKFCARPLVPPVPKARGFEPLPDTPEMEGLQNDLLGGMTTEGA